MTRFPIYVSLEKEKLKRRKSRSLTRNNPKLDGTLEIREFTEKILEEIRTKALPTGREPVVDSSPAKA